MSISSRNYKRHATVTPSQTSIGQATECLRCDSRNVQPLGLFKSLRHENWCPDAPMNAGHAVHEGCGGAIQERTQFLLEGRLTAGPLFQCQRCEIAQQTLDGLPHYFRGIR